MSEQWSAAIDQLTRVDEHEVLDYPVRRLHVNSVPVLGQSHTESTTPTIAQTDINAVRYPVIAENLYLLGYLKSKRRNKKKRLQHSSSFRKAVRQFQSDAALKCDGWVGHQTWSVLQTLVNFDTPIDVEQLRNERNQYRVAFKRAVELRLWVYGMAEKRPATNFRRITPTALKRFEQVATLLGAQEDTLHTLLDPEQLVQLAAKAEYQTLLIDDEAGANLRRFLLNLAKVELWLLGSDVKIDGKDNHPVEGLPPKLRRVRVARGWQRKPVRTKAVQESVDQYWADILGGNESTLAKHAGKICPELFDSLSHPEQYADTDAESETGENYSREIFEKYEQDPDPEKRVEEAWRTGKSLGMQLWDGLKRMWRWIRKGVRKVVEFAKNAFRAFYRFAAKAFVILKTAIASFGDCMAQYLNKRVRTDSDDIQVFMELDFDQYPVVAETADDEAVLQAAHAVRRFAAMFKLSCTIFGAFVDILKSAVAGLLGWARLLMVLVKSYRDIAPAYRELVALLPRATDPVGSVA